MFSELIQLIQLLFKSKPNDIDNTILKSMKHFPFKGYLYMMWCGYLVHREENFDIILSRLNTPQGQIDFNHENIHLCQAQQKKSWISYYLSYFWEWICLNPFSSKSYYLISYEMEAYANEKNLKYTEGYNSEYIKKYQIPFKERKQMYMNAGNTSHSWKSWLKKFFTA